MSESVAANSTAAQSGDVDASTNVSSMSSSLTDIVAASLPVSTGVAALSPTITSTTAGGVGDSTMATVSPAMAAVSAAAPVVSTATAGSPHSGASSISSPEQSATDVLDEHADAAMTIPLVRTPSATGTTIHIKPVVPIVQSAADTSHLHADTGALAADGVAESDGGDRLSGSEATEPATSSTAVNVSTASSSRNVTSAGLTISNDTSTEPLSDEVSLLLSLCLM